MTTITYEEFENVNFRSVTTLKVEEFPRAKKPSFKVWQDHRSAINIIATDENKRNQSLGSRFLTLIEKSLKSLGFKSIHAESRQSSLRFYLKNCYTKVPFNDPENHESDPNDVPVGKLL